MTELLTLMTTTSYVLVLKAKSFDSVVNELGEGAAYGGDMDADKTFTVADMTRISNIVLYGNETGPSTTTAPARATRCVEGDQITIDKQAEDMFFWLVEQMAEREGVTERLKAGNQMEWVARMNNIRSRATEIVNHDIIYN